MTSDDLHIPDLQPEIRYTAARSSGPGGQNVNKVNTKVELRFDVRNSELLDSNQKDQILKKLASRITSEGILVVVSQKSNSQLQNKEDALARFNQMIRIALTIAKPRKKTVPSKIAVEKRLTEKRIKSELKNNRQKIDNQ